MKNQKNKRIKITDITLRDAHQCLLATRLRTEDMLPIAEKIDRVGFWSLEVWGGATFDTMIRFLGEDPWERIRALRKAMPKTPFQMLLRGQNIVGYRHYSDDVVEKFIERSIANGISIIRIFDALNDLRNMKTAIEATLKNGGKVEGALCYTISPVHDHQHFVDLAKRLEDMGSDTICVKDMAGLLSPYAAYDLISRIKKTVGVPLHLHSHDTSGMGVATALKAIEAGVDIIDTATSSMASGTSHPPIEVLINVLKGTESDPGLDLVLLSEIGEYFSEVRKKYKNFESEFTGIDPNVVIYQVPGGMTSNLASQLKEQNALHRMKEVMEEVPKVRKDFGYPPLVTPTSQIVGTQATLNVLTGERYKVITSETKNYLKGLYGRPISPINEKVRKKAIGKDAWVDVRPADLIPPELERLKEEIKGKARDIDDVLTYALFPKVALEFFEKREKGELGKDFTLLLGSKIQKDEIPVPHLAPREFNIKVHGERYHVKIGGVGHPTEEGYPYFIYVDDQLEEVLVESLVEVVPSEVGMIDRKAGGHSIRPKVTEKGDVTTAMPGTVVSIKVKVGDQVKAGDTVLTVEAMKMENEIHTPIKGYVKEIFVVEGDKVNPDEVLVVVRA